MTYKISKEEMKQFALLLHKGIETKDMILLCFRDSQAMLALLEQGHSLQNIITHSNAPYMKTIRVLAQKIPFYDAISCSFRLEDQSKGWCIHILKQGLYPSFMFIFSYALMEFFQQSILPAMSALTHSEDFWMFYGILWLYRIGWMLMFITMGCIIILYIQPLSRKKMIPIFLKRIHLLRDMTSLQLAHILESLVRHGLSTHGGLQLMNELSHNPFLTYQIQKLNHQLHSGHSLQEALSSLSLDPIFIRFFTMGLQTSNIDRLLKVYREQGVHKFQVHSKKILICLQCLSYLSVGFVVLLVYQILLMPMNLLNTF